MATIEELEQLREQQQLMADGLASWAENQNQHNFRDLQHTVKTEAEPHLMASQWAEYEIRSRIPTADLTGRVDTAPFLTALEGLGKRHRLRQVVAQTANATDSAGFAMNQTVILADSLDLHNHELDHELLSTCDRHLNGDYRDGLMRLAVLFRTADSLIVDNDKTSPPIDLTPGAPVASNA